MQENKPELASFILIGLVLALLFACAVSSGAGEGGAEEERGYINIINAGLPAASFLNTQTPFLFMPNDNSLSPEIDNILNDNPGDLSFTSSTNVTLTPVVDATIDYLYPNTNFGTQDTLVVYYGGQNESGRALIRFNLAATVPSEAIIDLARLDLYLKGCQGPDSINLVAACLTEDWVESQVTWNNRPATGVPVEATLVDTTASPVRVNVTDIVRAWHNVPHYGLELRGPEGETAYNLIFESREHGEMPPQLVVTYHLPTYMLSGRVYAGNVGDESTPLSDGTVELYCSNDAGNLGTHIASTTTNSEGWYGLTATGVCEFYNILETDPADYTSVGATTVSGAVVTSNWIQYAYPLEGKTLTGNKFWDRHVGMMPDLVITDVWNEDSTICYQIRNIGDGVAPGGHYTALFVDDDYRVSDLVNADLEHGERWRGCFDYEWECTPREDTIAAWADYGDDVAEDNETNNRREESWKCDITPPKIISGPIVQNVTQDSAVIFWETNKDSDSVVKYGKMARIFAHEETDSTLVREHSITLSGLKPSTTYNFVVQSTDASGNTVESQDKTFETLSLSDEQDPIVSIFDPGVCQGTVTVTADASDDKGVEKVEFYLRMESDILDKLLFTDYSPQYQVTIDTTKYADGEYVLTAKAYDFSNRSASDTMPIVINNLKEAVDPYVNIVSHEDGDTISGKVMFTVSLGDTDSGLREAKWYIDNFSIGSQLYPNFDLATTLQFSYDTNNVQDGEHTIKVEAIDKDYNTAYDTVKVNVKNTKPPPPQPNLVITKHEVFRHGNVFAIELTVQNYGKGNAYNINIRDFLKGFQPISRSNFNFADYEAEYISVTMEGKCVITDSMDLGPWDNRTYIYAAIPVLVHPKPPKPSIGHSIKLFYEGPGTTKHEKTVTFAVFKTTKNVPLAKAYDKALKEADYLIVTNPQMLFVHYSGGNIGNEEVNTLLSTMAQLAKDKQGVLGYLHTCDAHTLDDLIEPLPPFIGCINCIKGQWAKKLHPDFSKPLKGYLLIVGEIEIVPAFDMDLKLSIGGKPKLHPVLFTDHPYADITGNGAPDLIVGRIIGDSAAKLIKPIQASVGVQSKTPGYGFDRSDALLVSGCAPWKGFAKGVNAIHKALFAQKLNVKTIHWKDNDSPESKLNAFKGLINGRDIIYYHGHGWPHGWGRAPGYPVLQTKKHFPLDFGETNPFVFATACNTGKYKDKTYKNSIARAFLDSDAGIYIGSTRESESGPNEEAAKKFFLNYWNSSLVDIGEAFTSMERHLWSRGKPSNWWWRWVMEYNLYGDPKFGSVLGGGGASKASTVIRQSTPPPTSLVLEIPDYEVTTWDGVHYVEIPGGELLLEPNQYQVPYYTKSIDYPKGSRVQDVILIQKSGLVTDTGLNLLVTPMDIEPSTYVIETFSLRPTGQEGWFPEEEYSWNILENPDGTTTLVIIMYPFYYNPLTTDVRFYKNYSFDINYTISSVEITKLETDKPHYDFVVDKVTGEVEFKFNDGEPGKIPPIGKDIVASAYIKRYGSDEIVDGLHLRTLKNFTGLASFSPQWDSSGFDPGYYYMEVTLKDTGGNVLDRKTEMFRLGISAGEIINFTATPEYFDIGDDVEINMIVNNSGTVNITGTAVIRIFNSTGYVVEEFGHNVTDLMPSELISFGDTWNTSGAEEGSYKILGYVLYDSKATDPVSVTVSAQTKTFDTGAGTYPSVMGNHTGTIKPNHTVIAAKMYTYSCLGTGGHTEYACIWNETWNATAAWEGYVEDWHNITFDKTIILMENETYNYTIRTGSYPQIHHTDELKVDDGTITCDKFIDVNGRIYYDWIPAIRLE